VRINYKIFPPICLAGLLFYCFCLLLGSSYRSLHDYQFVLVLNGDFLEKKKVDLIDIVSDVEKFKDDEKDDNSVRIFEPENGKLDAKSFFKKIDSLSEEEINNLTINIFHSLDLPSDVLDGIVLRSKARFISDLFYRSRYGKNNKFKFDFNQEINKSFKGEAVKNYEEDFRWKKILNLYKYSGENLFFQLAKSYFDQKRYEKCLENQECFEESDDDLYLSHHNYRVWIGRKINFRFFSNPDQHFQQYSVLPSIVTLLWLGIFIVISILSLGLFVGLYLNIFLEKDSKIKKYFLRLMNFFEFLPEIVLIGLFYIFFLNILDIKTKNIFILCIITLLILFPLIVNLVTRSLNFLSMEMKNNLQIADSKVKFLIGAVLPIISPYVAYHVLKTIAWISNFGFLAYLLNNGAFLNKVPSGFSDRGSLFVSDILSLVTNLNDEYLVSPILLTLLVMNAVFYSIAFFIKRFISFDFKVC
jgi:hypothetical protein